MATKNSRDVDLTVRAGVSGEADIRGLANEVRNLGKEGAAAAPELGKIADELDALAGQAGAIDTVKRLGAEVDDLTAKQRNAATVAAGVKAAYQEQKAATDALRSSVASARDAYDGVAETAINARAAYTKLRAEIGSLADATDAERVALRAAKVAQSEANAERERSRLALNKLTQELREAEKVEGTLAKQHERTAAAEAKSNTALRERQVALTQANAVAKAAGAATDDLAEAEVRLKGAVIQAAVTAETHRRNQIELAAAAKQAAAAADLATRAEQALFNIRKAAGQQNLAAEREAEAAALREVAAADAAAAAAAEKHAAATAKAAAEIDRLATEARDMVRAAEYTRFWADELDRLDRETQQAAEAQAQLVARAKAAAQAMDDSFGKTGVRSLQSIQNEINETTAALAHLERQAAAGAITQRDLDRATGGAQARLQALRQELQSMPAAAGVFERLNTQVLDLVNRFGALTAAIATVGFAVKPLFDATTQLESMRRVLTQVFGSIEAANREIAFVNDVADRAGVRIDKIGESYTRFATSARTAGIDAGTVRAVFEATTLAAGNLGLSTDKTTHILDALAQMANKGKVSMEELRQQLGDSLPGALGLMAKGLGITVPQLVQMVETGQLLTEHALKPMADAMTELASKEPKVLSLAAAWNRLANGVTLAYQKAADTTAYKTLAVVLESVANNFDKVVTGAKYLAEALLTAKIVSYVGNLVSLRTATAEVATTTAAATAATAANTAATATNTTTTAANTAAKVANSAANASNAAAWTALAAGIGAVGPQAAKAEAQAGLLSRTMTGLGGAARSAVSLIGGLPGVLAVVALNARELGTWIGESIAKMTEQGKVLEANERKWAAEEEQLRKNAEAQKQVGQAWVSLAARYTEATAPLEKNIQAAKEHVKVAKEQGESIKRVAELSGDASQELAANARAADLNAAASRRLANEEAARTKVLEDYILALERQAQTQGRLSDAEKKRLEELHDELKVLRETRAEAEAKAETDRVAAQALALYTENTKDHSSELGTLRAAYESATESVALFKEQQDRGLATTAQVIAAEERQAAALNRYRDAIGDAIRMSNERREAIRLDSAESQANLTVREAQIATDLKHAQILGDVRLQTEAEVKAKELQIERVKASAAARVAESQEVIRRLQLDKEAIRGNDDTAESERRLIQIRIEHERVKLREAEASKSVVRGLELEIDALQRRANAQAGSLSSGFDATKNQARSTVGGATYDDQGFATGPDGQRITAGGQLQPPDGSGNWEFISDATALGGSQTVTLANGRKVNGRGVQGVGYWIRTDGGGGFGVRQGAGVSGGALSGGSGLGTSAQGGLGVTRAPAPAQTPARFDPSQAVQPPEFAAQPVIINLPGQAPRTINVASLAEAQALQDLLRVLALGQGTAAGG